MTPDPWQDFARQARGLFDQQQQMAKEWMEGQARLAEALGGGRPATEQAAAMAELWKSWLMLGGALGSAAVGQAVPGKAGAGRIAGETLGRFLDPVSLTLMGGSQIGDTIRRMTEGPRLADIGIVERRMARVMELWLQTQTAARRYEAVVAEAWTAAGRRFMADLQERRGDGEARPSAKEALGRWLDIANGTLLETQRSDRFLEAQGELLRHAMDFLLAERELVEGLVEPAGLPTRSEIDEAHRSIQDLKRRVRALEKGRAVAAPDRSAAPTSRTARTRARKRAAAGGAR